MRFPKADLYKIESSVHTLNIKYSLPSVQIEQILRIYR